MINKEKLKDIALNAIKTKDFHKLRYIGQTIDCLLFEPEYSDDEQLYILFTKISKLLNNNDFDLLHKLEVTNYPDLDEIGFPKCETFDNLNEIFIVEMRNKKGETVPCCFVSDSMEKVKKWMKENTDFSYGFWYWAILKGQVNGLGFNLYKVYDKNGNLLDEEPIQKSFFEKLLINIFTNKTEIL